MDTAKRVFTVAELARYDGKEERPAYIAYGGVVYDVTSSLLWPDGSHEGLHEAGEDLTDQLTGAPHGEELMLLLPVMGILK